MNRFLKTFCFMTAILTGTATLGALQPAAGVEVRVNAGDVVTEISPLVFGNSVIHTGDTMGFNKWISDQRTYDEAKRKWNYYLPYTSELGPTVLRYPGGLAANNFAWKPGVGPIETRDPNFTETGVPQTFGTDEFLQYCKELRAEAILVVNVSVTGQRQGTVQDAADWVEYCNAPNDGSNPGGGVDWAAQRAANGHAEPYGVKYWELGNEDTFPGWENYAERVGNYSEAMKAVDPSIQVGVIRTGAGLDTLYNRSQWLDYHTFMLDSAADSFDFWIHHAHGPATTGSVDGLAMISNGASVNVSFSVQQEGDYRFELLTEGTCRGLLCPRLVLQVNGETQGDWNLILPLNFHTSLTFHLNPGTHELKLQAFNLGNGRMIVVQPYVNLFREGEESATRVDLRDSLEWYRALLGYVPVAREAFLAADPYTGGKPVFYTEVSTIYSDAVSPPYYHKTTALREILNTGCFYHFLLNQGIELTNYWLLFQEGNGSGVLEGVAQDDESGELGRLDPHRRPVFHLLKTYRWNVLDRVVSTEVLDGPEFPVGPQTGIYLGYAQMDFQVPYLQALATVAEDEDRMSLFVINLDPVEDHQVPVSIQGFQPKSKVEVLTISGSSPASNNEPEDCPNGECVMTEESVVWLQGNSFLYDFPKHSITVFVLNRTGSDQIAPEEPSMLRGLAGDAAVLLEWDAAGDADLQGYHVYSSRCPEGPYLHRVNAAPVAATEYLQGNLDNDVTVTYAVTSVDLWGNESGFSNKVNLTPFAGGGTPQGPLPNGGDDVTPPPPPFLIEAESL